MHSGLWTRQTGEPRRCPPRAVVRLHPRDASLPVDVQMPEHGAVHMTEHVVTRWYRAPELMLSPNGEYT